MSPPLPIEVGPALHAARRRLEAAGVPTPDVDALLLLRHVTGWTRARVLTRVDRPLSHAEHLRFGELLDRRVARVPLQLLVGSVGFRHLDVVVGPGVFIPRPETEVLAGLAVERTPAHGLVLEPCTGTGAIACAVATEAAGARVVATDRDPTAVLLARRNAVRCDATVEVLEGDLLGPVDPALRGRVDVVVSNPPYVAAGELDALEPEVVEHDPRTALVSGPTGHELSDRLIAEARSWLRAGGWLLLEIAEVRAGAVAARCEAGGYLDVDVVADLSGRDRFVMARCGDAGSAMGDR